MSDEAVDLSPLLALLDGFEPMQCELCVTRAVIDGLPPGESPVVGPHLGEAEVGGRKVPAAVWKHGNEIGGPHWVRTVPVGRR